MDMLPPELLKASRYAGICFMTESGTRYAVDEYCTLLSTNPDANAAGLSLVAGLDSKYYDLACSSLHGAAELEQVILARGTIPTEGLHLVASFNGEYASARRYGGIVTSPILRILPDRIELNGADVYLRGWDGRNLKLQPMEKSELGIGAAESYTGELGQALYEYTLPARFLSDAIKESVKACRLLKVRAVACIGLFFQQGEVKEIDFESEEGLKRNFTIRLYEPSLEQKLYK